MLKVEFEGPDIREEGIYKIFRVGLIYIIRPPTHSTLYCPSLMDELWI